MQKAINLQVELPPTPKELLAKIQGKIDGSETGATETIIKSFPIGEFTDKELREVGRQWTENLLSEATKQREESNLVKGAIKR